MPATPYSPVVFTGDLLDQVKMQRMATNQQWLFENMPRVRYVSAGLIRDSGTKMISGSSAYNATPGDAADVFVYFGNFFTAGCNPNVVVTVNTNGGWLRKFATTRSLAGLSAPIDHTGFIAHVSTHERANAGTQIEAGGWVHWIAVGY